MTLRKALELGTYYAGISGGFFDVRTNGIFLSSYSVAFTSMFGGSVLMTYFVGYWELGRLTVCF